MVKDSIKQTGGEFGRFFVVGVGATLLHLVVYWVLNAVLGATDVSPLLLTLTYLIGYAVSFVANYVVSLRWTFKTQGNVGNALGFAFSHAVNAGMQVGLLNFFNWIGLGGLMVSFAGWVAPWLVELVPLLGQPEALLPLPVYVIVVPMNFFMVRFFLKR